MIWIENWRWLSIDWVQFPSKCSKCTIATGTLYWCSYSLFGRKIWFVPRTLSTRALRHHDVRMHDDHHRRLLASRYNSRFSALYIPLVVNHTRENHKDATQTLNTRVHAQLAESQWRFESGGAEDLWITVCQLVARVWRQSEQPAHSNWHQTTVSADIRRHRWRSNRP